MLKATYHNGKDAHPLVALTALPVMLVYALIFILMAAMALIEHGICKLMGRKSRWKVTWAGKNEH